MSGFERTEPRGEPRSSGVDDSLPDSRRSAERLAAGESPSEAERAAAPPQTAPTPEEAIELATLRTRELIFEGEMDRAEEILRSTIGEYGEHAELARLGEETRAVRVGLAMLSQPAPLVSHVKAMRARGDLSGAAFLLRQALQQGLDNAEIRSLLAQTQRAVRLLAEERAWHALVSQTRARVDEHVERGELDRAQEVLTRAEDMHGAIAELEDLKAHLEVLRREHECARLAAHLREAQRLRDEGRLQESVGEAQEVLALDPHHREAAAFVDSAIVEIEERELQAAAWGEAAQIDALLECGALLRAGLWIRRSRRKYGDLPAFRHLSQRRRRLRTTRCARRRARVREWGRKIPIAKIRAFPRSVFEAASQLASRGWARVAGTAGRLVGWFRGRFEDWRTARARGRIARLQAAEWARHALVTETRARVEEHIERQDLARAAEILARVENEHGAIDELEDLGSRLQGLRREHEHARFALHSGEARRLRDAGRLQESLGEARQALALAPHEPEATALVASLVAEIDEREVQAATRRRAVHIDALLQRGALLRAALWIRASRREHGDLPAFRDQSQRCRRLRATYWAKRWDRVRGWARKIPFAGIEAFSRSVFAAAQQLAARGSAGAARSAGRLAAWIEPRLAVRVEGRARLLVAAGIVVALATAGIQWANVRGQRDSYSNRFDPVPVAENAAELDPVAAAASSPTGDLILDALPWARVVAIIGPRGKRQQLGQDLFTPVRLSLPAGTYRIILENPAVGEPAEFRVQVPAAGTTSIVHEFRPFDADAYFSRAQL